MKKGDEFVKFFLIHHCFLLASFFCIVWV